MYPIMLNIDGKKCIVIGGGRVALRKAKKLSECGGCVTVISPEFANGFETFDTIKREYKKSDLQNAFLVTAATGDKSLNCQITADARDLGILSYAVDDAEHSDFILPASYTSENITVAVSTHGKYPFLAKKLRDETASAAKFYGTLLPILEKYRLNIIRECPDNKAELLKSLVSDEMIELAKTDTALFEQKIKEIYIKNTK